MTTDQDTQAPAAPPEGDVQQVPGFVRDNDDVLDGAPPKWDELAPRVREAFPDFTEGQLGGLKETYTRNWNLGAARRIAEHAQENAGTKFMRDWLPAAGTAINMKRAVDYDAARQRFEAGTPSDDDYQRMALYEATQQRDAAEPWYERTAKGTVKLVGELGMSGGLSAPAAGAKGILPWAGGALARAGIRTALMPSSGAQNVVEANQEAGRPPLDPRGLPPGLLRAFANQFAFEAAGGAAGKLVPGAGLKAAVGRTALAGVEVPIIQQGADLLSYGAGLQTGYGTLQELREGKYGQAGQSLAGQILVGAIMHGVHEGQDAGRARLADMAARLKEQQGKGYSLETAAEAVIKHFDAQGPEPGIDREGLPTPQPGHTADGGIEPVPGEFPQPAAPQAPEAPPIAPEPQADPTPAPEPTPPPEAPQEPAEPQGLDAETLRAAMLKLGMPAGKWSADKVRAEAQRLGLDRAADATPPRVPQKPADFGTPEPPPEPPPEAPEQASPEPPPGPKPGQPTDWHTTYADRRAKGYSHDQARQAADLQHDEGQSWVHSGTEFSGPDRDQFVGGDGKTYRIDPRFWDAQTDKGGEHGGVRLGVKDAAGKEVASVGFLKGDNGAWRADGSPLMSEKDEAGNVKVRGLGRALYDHMVEAGQTVVPGANGRTDEGKGFWRKNAEKAVRPEAPAPDGAPANPAAADPIQQHVARILAEGEPKSKVELWRRINRERQAQGLGKVPLDGVEDSLDAMRQRGDLERRPGTADADPTYAAAGPTAPNGPPGPKVRPPQRDVGAKAPGQPAQGQEPLSEPQVRAALANIGLQLQHAIEHSPQPTPAETAQDAARNREMVAQGLNATKYPGVGGENLEKISAEHKRNLTAAANLPGPNLVARAVAGQLDPALLDALEKNPGWLTHNPEYRRAIADAAERIGIEPEALRRALAAHLHEDLAGPRPADAEPAGGQAAAPHAGPETAGAVPEAADRQLVSPDHYGRYEKALKKKGTVSLGALGDILQGNTSPAARQLDAAAGHVEVVVFDGEPQGSPAQYGEWSSGKKLIAINRNAARMSAADLAFALAHEGAHAAREAAGRSIEYTPGRGHDDEAFEASAFRLAEAVSGQKTEDVRERLMGERRPVSPIERARRGRAVPKEYEATAREEGIDPDHLHGAARQIMVEDKEAVAEHNAILKEARNHGNRQATPFARAVRMIHLERYENPGDVPGLDEVAETTALRHPSLFDPDRESVDQTLFDLLKAGNRKPLGERAAYEQALDFLRDRQEIERVAERARQTGGSERALEEALRSGQEDGKAASEAEEGPPDPPGDRDEGASAAEAEAEAGEHADTSFDFGAEPEPAAGPGPGGPVPGGGPEPGRPGNPLVDLARRLAEEEHGSVPVPHEWANQKIEELRGYARGAADFFAKLGQRVAPKTLRLSRLANQRIGELDAAPGKAAYMTPVMIEKVLGKDATPADDLLAGSVVTERRLRYAKAAFSGESAKASANAARLRAEAQADAAAGYRQHPADVWQQMVASEARRATEFMRKAQGVKSAIGWQGNPLQTFADYQKAIADPKVQEWLRRWDDPQNGMVPIMERNFRDAQGLEDTDPIHSLTQVPGSPVNLKSLGPDEPDTPTTVSAAGRGNLRNVRQGKLVFANEFTGTAERYDLSLGAIINNSLDRGYKAAAKANLYRGLVSEGLAVWGKPGETHYFEGQKAKGDLDARPPLGTQEATQGQTTLYADPRVYDEVRQVLAVDKPPSGLGKAGAFLNGVNLAGIADAMTHTKNLATFTTRLGVRGPADVVNRIFDVMRNDLPTKERLASLAGIDALQSPRPHGLIPQWGKMDPTSWTGRLIETVDHAMRLAADDAFTRAAGKKDVTGAPLLLHTDDAARRDFINQIGNYSKRTQSKLVGFLRDTGLGPFATAGSAWNMNALRSLVGDTGMKATTWQGDLQLRAGMLGRTAAVLAAVPIINALVWGRPDGDDKTPLGAVKIGTREDGTTSYIPAASWLGIDRGAKLVGAGALAEGLRTNRPLAHSADKAMEDAVEGWGHPAMGPVPQFGYTWYTGKNTLGIPVAAKAGAGQSQEWQNFLAAFKNANPAAGAALGANRPQNPPQPLIPQTGAQALERAASMARPFVGQRKTPPGKDTGLMRR